MSLRLKFNLVLAGVLLVAATVTGMYIHRFLQNSAIEEVKHNSQIMMQAALAIRDYTTELVKPHLDVTLPTIGNSASSATFVRAVWHSTRR